MIYATLLRTSRLMAALGGVVLVALILMTCVSVLGRGLNTALHGDWMQSVLPGLAERALAFGVGPVNGDFEMVEAGVAFAIFAFLPLCHLTGSHATVDIFTSKLPRRLALALEAVIALVFAAVMVLIAVQLGSGMAGKIRSGQTTFLIEFPVWWAYAASLAGAGLAALVAVYMAVVRAAEAATGRDLLPETPA